MQAELPCLRGMSEEDQEYGMMLCLKCIHCEKHPPLIGAVTDWYCKAHEKEMCSENIGDHFTCIDFNIQKRGRK